MANIDKLTDALTEWGANVAKSVLPKIQVPPTSTIGRVMSGFFGINTATYSIYDELGFIIEPAVRTMIMPMVTKYVGELPDDKIEELAMMFAGEFKKRAAEKGHVNVFGIQLGESAFIGLEEILTEKFK